ncbi:MAG: winged helix-turn-helix domain-containing protein [Anaerolineae bacterium]|nr:winged helix-turn-helix domain-containing protein [Anaerolineae bacterium]
MKPIPTRSDWLLPFIRVLSDEQPHKRGDILKSVANQLNLTEAQLGTRFAVNDQLVVRYYLDSCEAKFCKAGWVVKLEPNEDNMSDVFQITPLGLEEFQKNPEQISIAYLRSFWKQG